MFDKIKDRLNDNKTQKILLLTTVVALGFALLSNMYHPYSDEESKKNIMQYIDTTSTKVANEAKKLDISDKHVACKDALDKQGLKLNKKEEEIIVNFCAKKI